jgi:hypothetical protein
MIKDSSAGPALRADGEGLGKPMNQETDDRRNERESLIATIEEEMARILAAERGIAGVQIHIERLTGSISCSHAIPLDQQNSIFAAAVKQAILRRNGDAERGPG